MLLDSKGLRASEMLVALVLTPLALHSGLACALVIEAHRAWTLPITKQKSEYSPECFKLSKGLTRLIKKDVRVFPD